MEKEEFYERFASEIRVKLDWQRFQDSGVHIRMIHLQLPRDLQLLWTPWRSVVGDGESHEGHSAPASVLAVAGDLGVAGRHAAGVRDKEQTVGSADLEAPALELPQGRYLLLDGNHKVVAAAVRQIPLQLKLFVISKPADMQLTPDIAPFD